VKGPQPFQPVLAARQVLVYDNLATGARAGEARHERGLTLREVAARMGFTPMYISDLERGRRAWREELVQLYFDALDMGRKRGTP